MKRIASTMVGVGLMFLLAVCWADEQAPLQDRNLKDPKFKDSYSLGYEFGATLKMRGVDLDADVLLSAARDALEGKKPALSVEEIRETLNQMKKKVLVMQDQRYREYAAKNLEESKEFMEANKSKPDVKALPSGLQYKVMTEGSGAVPKPSDTVKVSFLGRLKDGTEFDSSRGLESPVIIRVDGMMKGWTEALQLMKVGSKWQVFVPPWLGYGEKRFRLVPPNSVLIYEMELLSIEGAGNREMSSLPAQAPSSSAPAREKKDEQHPDNHGVSSSR